MEYVMSKEVNNVITSWEDKTGTVLNLLRLHSYQITNKDSEIKSVMISTAYLQSKPLRGRLYTKNSYRKRSPIQESR